MITCQHARQLFDRYLDDELSPSLQAELHAHVISCAPCQNHLALVEACGDVIRMDRREPKPSGSFTDRVMAARREHGMAITRAAGAGRWRRAGWWIAGPLAAAASIALVLTVGTPMFDSRPTSSPHTVVGAQKTAAPEGVRKKLMELAQTQLGPVERQELENTPAMKPLPFLEALVNPLVEGTQNAVSGTRQSYEDMQLLARYLFDGTADRLLAEYRQKYPDVSQQSTERATSTLDILGDVLAPAPTDQPTNASPAPSFPASPDAAASPDAL